MSELAGKSVLDLLWERLDAFVDALMEPVNHEEASEETKGRAYGMAEAIALITNPYYPDIDAVRGEAMERWGQRNAVPPPPDPRGTPVSERGLARRRRRAARRALRNG